MENVNPADQEEIGSAYTFVTTENIASADSSVAYKASTFSITEGVTVADTEQLQAQFNLAISEGLIPADSTLIGGWYKINDTQNPQWGGLIVTITGYGIPGDFMFGGAPIAGYLENTTTDSQPIGVTPIITWVPINDVTATNWVKVNNYQ